MQSKVRQALALTATLLIVLGGCSSDPTPSKSAATTTATSGTPSTSAPSTSAAPYVALGDSFTAGPGISPQQEGAGLCQRSTQSWPDLVAASLKIAVKNVSCSGATTADLASTVASGTPGPDTELVTVSAGGNDGGLFLSLIRACASSSDTCRTFGDQQVPTVLDQTTADLGSLLQAVRTAAPQATVVLVGYPRILPESGTCAAAGLAAANAPSVVSAEVALDDALAEAADTAGVTYVSLRSGTKGHDACAGDGAWTNGAQPAAGDGIVFHPNRRGMAGVAALVAAKVKR